MISERLNITYSLPEILTTARRVLEGAEGRRIFTLEGDLGAGKTTFVTAAAQILGATRPVTSPTFTLMHAYPLPHGGEIYHFDCYRLRSIEEALEIGINEYLDGEAYCFIEWPEIIAPLLPAAYVRLRFQFIDETTRGLIVEE